MKREELEEKIKNGESVWACDDFLHRVIPYKANEIAITGINTNMPAYELKDLFATKQQAEHYLHHANVTRTETLPFLTWEEFLEETRLTFIACDGVSNMILYCCNNTIYLVDEEYPEFNTTSWDLTEANFYKAYDECVRMFKGDSNVQF